MAVLELIDDKNCKMMWMETEKEWEDQEKCPDSQISTQNIMTGIRAINRLAAMLNFDFIDGEDHEAVCDIFDSLQTAHSAIADVAGTLATLGRRLDPNQFQFLLKHSIRPLV